MPNNRSDFHPEIQKKIIYFDHIFDMWAFQPDSLDFPLEFDSYAQLVFHCIQAYGQEIEFHEITPDNWQQLYDSGAFG
jgi:hypothetical protein